MSSLALHHRKVAKAIKQAKARHIGKTEPLDTLQDLLGAEFQGDPDFNQEVFANECEPSSMETA
jgi:hypothetical protein